MNLHCHTVRCEYDLTGLDENLTKIIRNDFKARHYRLRKNFNFIFHLELNSPTERGFQGKLSFWTKFANFWACFERARRVFHLLGWFCLNHDLILVTLGYNHLVNSLVEVDSVYELQNIFTNILARTWGNVTCKFGRRVLVARSM